MTDGTVTISIERFKQLESAETALEQIIKDKSKIIWYTNYYQSWCSRTGDEIAKENFILKERICDLENPRPQSNKKGFWHNLFGG